MQTLFLLSLVVSAAMGFHGTFNGASCYSAPTSASIATITSALTVEFWVYPLSGGSIMGVTGTWDDVTGNKRSWFVWLDNLKPTLYSTSAPTTGSAIATPNALLPNEWAHVAFAKSSSGAVKVYVNGVQVATGSLPASTYVNSEPLRVGCAYAGGAVRYMSGYLDGVHIWNMERTATEIQNGMASCGAPASANLIAQYKFDEGTGTTLTDSSGHGNSAPTSHGTPGWSAGNANGLVCPTPPPAANFHGTFNGASCYSAPTSASIATITSALTVEFWVFPLSGGSIMGVTGTWDDVTGNKRSWFVWLDNLKPTLYSTSAPTTGSAIATPNALLPNEWAHVAFSKSSSGAVKVYVNGVQVATGSLPATTYVNSEPLRVGCAYAGGFVRYMSGYLDNVRIWNVERTATEIQNGMASCGAPPSANLIAQYKFDEGTGTTLTDSSGNGNSAPTSHGTPGWSAGNANGVVCSTAPGHATAFCDNIASQCTIIDAECTTIRNGGHTAVADDCDASAAACNAVEADCREAAENCPLA